MNKKTLRQFIELEENSSAGAVGASAIPANLGSERPSNPNSKKSKKRQKTIFVQPNGGNKK